MNQGKKADGSTGAMLLPRLRRRDPVALREWLSEHQAGVYGWLCRILSDEHAAEDLSQEVFLIAIEKIDSLRDAEKMSAWLRGIARNLAMEHLRSRRGEIVHGSSSMPAQLDEPISSVVERAETLERLSAEIRRLPSDQATALRGYYFEGLSGDALAHRMGKSANAVNVLLCRARAALYERMKDSYEEC